MTIATQKTALTAEDTFTTAVEIRGKFNLSLSNTWVGTITLQRAFPDAPTTWFDVKTYTANIQDVGEEAETGVKYRAGFKAGQFTSGTADVRVSQ